MSPKNRERWLKLWQDPERVAKMLASGPQPGKPRTDLDARTKAEMVLRVKKTKARKKLSQ